MNNKHQRLQGTLIRVIPAILLSLQMPLSASANSAVGLQPETPRVDSSITANPGPVANLGAFNPLASAAGGNTTTDQPASQDSPPAEEKPLQGKVFENDSQASADKDQSSQMQPESPQSDNNPGYALAVQKLQSNIKLSADDYRNLGVGTLGLESVRTFFQDKAKVEQVYKGGPAEQAGIRVGDVLLDNNHDDSKVTNPTVPQWGITLARAGTVSDITLLRHGQPTTITLTRMNVEDLPDAKIRKVWEGIIDNLGHPATEHT